MRKIVIRNAMLRLFKDGNEIPYELYAKTPAAFLIGVAVKREKYAPGDGPEKVLQYNCRIRLPEEQGFFDSEDSAPVILSAIVNVIGRENALDFVSQYMRECEQSSTSVEWEKWFEELKAWETLLARSPKLSDLPVLLQDLSRCGFYGLASCIEDYCKKNGLTPP